MMAGVNTVSRVLYNSVALVVRMLKKIVSYVHSCAGTPPDLDLICSHTCDVRSLVFARFIVM